MTDDRLSSAVSAGVLASESAHRQLLTSVAETARAIFGARAASIFLYDEASDELVFEAVAGSGERLAAGPAVPLQHRHRGMGAGHPSAAGDRGRDQRSPLRGGRCVGHRIRAEGHHGGAAAARGALTGRARGAGSSSGRAFTLAEMDLLGLFANQAAIALDLMARSRRARAALDGSDPGLSAVAAIARHLDELEDDRQEAGRRLLLALADVLAPSEEREPRRTRGSA